MTDGCAIVPKRSQYAKTWAAEVTELRDKLNSVGIDTMYSCFSSKALLRGAGATGLSSIGLGSDPLIAGAAGAAGLAVGAMSVIRRQTEEGSSFVGGITCRLSVSNGAGSETCRPLELDKAARNEIDTQCLTRLRLRPTRHVEVAPVAGSWAIIDHLRNPEHRELFLSGLRLAAGETA